MASCFSRICLLVVVVTAVPVLRAQREKLPADDLDVVEKNFPDAKKTDNGIRYIIQAEGEGDSPKAGDLVSLLYAGRLLNGTVFDQNVNREHPMTFRLGRSRVIEGWEEILPLMKRGERRLVIIPPELAYGMRGLPPRIPREATLVFLIELLDFKSE